MVVTQYRDLLQATIYTGESTYDENTGNWTNVGSPVNVQSDCRYEPNDGNGSVVTEDGERIDFSGTVFLPLVTFELKKGMAVQVTVKRENRSDIIINEKIKRFFPHQMNTEIWL